MTLPFVVLYNNNIEAVVEQTGWTKEALEEALKFYKRRVSIQSKFHCQ